MSSNTPFNTGLPVPSTDKRDLHDNALTIDNVTNGTSGTNRLGVVLKGLPVIVAEVEASAAQAELDIIDKVAELGVIFDDPIRDWTPSLLVDDLRAHRYPATTGDIYIPIKPLPFTTGGTFNTDDWAVYQGALESDVNEGDSQVVGGGIYPENISGTAINGNNITTPSLLLRVIGTLYYMVKTDGTQQSFTGVISNLNISTAPFSVTVGADNCYLLVKSFTNYHAKKLSLQALGAVSDDTTDINPVLLAFDDMAGWNCELIEGEEFFNGSTYVPTRYVELTGPHTKESKFTTWIRCPLGQNSIEITDPLAVGSRLSGFALLTPQDRAIGGGVIEYNSVTGTMLFTGGTTARPDGDYEVRNARILDTITAGITISSQLEKVGTARAIEHFGITGTFQEGEIITGVPSGKTATLFFVSEKYNAIIAMDSSGVFEPDDVITGTDSAATLTVAIASSNTFDGELFTCAVTVNSGTIGVPDNTGFANEVFTQAGTFGYGVLMTRRAYCRDMRVVGFSGDPFLIATTDGYVGNANLCEVSHCAMVNNGGNALRIIGGDSNAGKFDFNTSVKNFGFPICDRSFLGNTFTGWHASFSLSGGYNSTNNTHRDSTFINCYSEGSSHVIAPWPVARTQISGSTIFIGGTRGLPVVREISSGANDFGGYDVQSDIQEGAYDFFKNEVRQIRPKNDDAESLRIVNKGNSPDAIISGGANADSDQGVLEERGSYLTHELIFGNTEGTQKNPYTKLKMRRKIRGAIAEVAGDGSDDEIQVDTDGAGVVTGFVIISGGKDWIISNTVVTVRGSDGVFIPVVQDGVITRIDIISAGTGADEADMIEVFSATSDGVTIAFDPGEDDQTMLGSTASLRYKGGRVVTDWIVGSDYRLKMDIKDIPQALCDFVLTVPMKQYKLKSNDSGRNHFGVIITTEFITAFNAVYSIDDCAALCHDIFTDEDGSAVDKLVGGVMLGDVWQVRYTEWQNIMLEAMRRKIIAM